MCAVTVTLLDAADRLTLTLTLLGPCLHAADPDPAGSIIRGVAPIHAIC